MRRYLVVSLMIGVVVSIAVVTMIWLGVYAPLASSLGDLFAGMGFATSDRSGGWPETVLVITIAFSAAWCVIDIPRVGQKLLVFLLLGVITFALSPTLALYGVQFEPFSGMTALLLATGAGFAYAGTEHGTRKRLLINVLGSRVSRDTFHRLLDSREPIRFGGSTRTVTVLTCRLFNHAELREKLEPGEIVAMSNLFLRNTADFLMSRGGYLDESSPDLVRVYFGLVQENDDHAGAACRAALELRTRLRNLKQECETRWFHSLVYGVAIGSGPTTIGVFGSPGRFHFSGIGSETDFSRRLAQANTRYDSDLLISAQAYQMVKDEVEVRPLEMLYDPDRNLMLEVYQLLALEDDFEEAERSRRDAFWEGVVLYRSGRFEEAITRFSEAQTPGKVDGPLQFFIERSQRRLAGEEEVPEESRQLTDEGHARLLNLM